MKRTRKLFQLLGESKYCKEIVTGKREVVFGTKYRDSLWRSVETKKEGMYVFIALHCLTGLVKCPLIIDHWSGLVQKF